MATGSTESKQPCTTYLLTSAAQGVQAFEEAEGDAEEKEKHEDHESEAETARSDREELLDTVHEADHESAENVRPLLKRAAPLQLQRCTAWNHSPCAARRSSHNADPLQDLLKTGELHRVWGVVLCWQGWQAEDLQNMPAKATLKSPAAS